MYERGNIVTVTVTFSATTLAPGCCEMDKNGTKTVVAVET